MKLQVIKSESFNTNNAWGFGGVIGTKFYYSNGLVHTKAKACHRHTGTSNADRVEFNYKGELINVVADDLKFTELYIYENETGYKLAMPNNEGDGFERNYHDYKFIDHITF